MKRAFLSLAVVLAISGCASTTENLQRETARPIGDVLPDTVNVKSVDRGVTSIKWEAETPKGPL